MARPWYDSFRIVGGSYLMLLVILRLLPGPDTEKE